MLITGKHLIHHLLVNTQSQFGLIHDPIRCFSFRDVFIDDSAFSLVEAYVTAMLTALNEQTQSPQGLSLKPTIAETILFQDITAPQSKGLVSAPCLSSQEKMHSLSSWAALALCLGITEPSMRIVGGSTTGDAVSFSKSSGGAQKFNTTVSKNAKMSCYS